jgi:hypothetical protein
MARRSQFPPGHRGLAVVDSTGYDVIGHRDPKLLTTEWSLSSSSDKATAGKESIELLVMGYEVLTQQRYGFLNVV